MVWCQALNVTRHHRHPQPKERGVAQPLTARAKRHEPSLTYLQGSPFLYVATVHSKLVKKRQGTLKSWAFTFTILIRILGLG